MTLPEALEVNESCPLWYLVCYVRIRAGIAVHWCVPVNVCRLPHEELDGASCLSVGGGCDGEGRLVTCEYPGTYVSLVISMCIEKCEMNCHHIWFWL